MSIEFIQKDLNRLWYSLLINSIITWELSINDVTLEDQERAIRFNWHILLCKHFMDWSLQD